MAVKLKEETVKKGRMKRTEHKGKRTLERGTEKGMNVKEKRS